MDLYLFPEGALYVDGERKESWFDYPPETLSLQRLDVRSLRRRLSKRVLASVRRVFLFVEYFWFSTDLNVYAVSESQAKEVLIKNFSADNKVARSRGIVYKTTSSFIGRAVAEEVIEALQQLFPKAYIYSGSLALGDYWISRILPAKVGKNLSTGDRGLAFLVVKGSGLIYYGQAGFLEFTTSVPALARLSLISDPKKAEQMRVEVANSLNETLALVADRNIEETGAFFAQSAKALSLIGIDLGQEHVYSPIPPDWKVPPELAYAKPSLTVASGRKLSVEHVLAVLGILAYAGSFAYQKFLEAELDKTLQELAVLEARRSNLKRKDDERQALQKEVGAIKGLLSELEARPQRVYSFLRLYAEKVPPEYRISDMGYGEEGGIRLSVVSPAGLERLIEALSSEGTVEVLSYKKVSEGEAHVKLVFKPRGW